MKKLIGILVLSFIVFGVCGQQNNLDTISHKKGVLSSLTNIAEWGMDLITVEKKNSTIFILPAVGYEERTGLSIGVTPSWRFYLGGKQDKAYFRPSNVTLSSEFSTTGMFELYVSTDLYTKNGWYLKNKTLGQYMPDKFYNIGNNSNKSIISEIEVRKFESAGRFLKIISKNWFVGLNYDAGYYAVKNVIGNTFNSAILGFEDSWFSCVGPTFTFDSRNNVIYPEKGLFVESSYLANIKGVGGNNFSSFTFDVRKFYSVGENEKVVGVQMYMNSVFGDVPFYRLASIGGKRKYRGIGRPYKYMDNNAAYLQIVYRSRLWWKLGYEVFTGVGNVFDTWNKNVIQNLHCMGGLGVRMRVLDSEKLSLRLDYGVSSRGDKGLYFTLGEAF